MGRLHQVQKPTTAAAVLLPLLLLLFLPPSAALTPHRYYHHRRRPHQLNLTPQSAVSGGQDGGQWELLQRCIGVSAMHMTLLHNDRVIIFDRTSGGPSNISFPNCDPAATTECTAHSVEYDVAGNSVRPLTVLTDTWCSSGATLPDGKLVQTGGWTTGGRNVRLLQSCDDWNCDWQEIADGLAAPRWYASNHILPDGRQIIIGGRRQFTYEFYPKDSTNPGAIYFPFLRETFNYVSEDNLYPFVHLLPDGNLFIFANNQSIVFDYRRNAVVKRFPVMPVGGPRNYPSTGSSVMLPLVMNSDPAMIKVEVLICGGAPAGSFFHAHNDGTFVDALSTCGRITVTDRTPDWSMETMPTPRVMSDMLLLPTGDVLIINGASSGTAGWESARKPVLSPVIYRTWRTSGSRFDLQNPTTIPRMYHSTAVLLRDGRVLVGGSNTHPRYNFTGLFPTDLSLERFSPDYCFSPSQPTILTPASQTSLAYGQNFAVEFSVSGVNPSEVPVSVSMVAPPFNTHSYSMNQRMLVLQWNRRVALTASSSSSPAYDAWVSAPPSSAVAPPGYYLLFVVVGEAASEGIWVHIQ
ncbi:WSC domain-containing protein [Nymphaea thermarum]|nr:WSC domain-containing protein [Nymphaea thermarum]